MANLRFFVSFDFDDWEYVRQTLESLNTQGYEFLVAKRNLVPGQSFVVWMNKMLEISDLFVLFWSKYSSTSRFVTMEWSSFLGINQREKILIIRIDDTPLPILLSTCIYVDIKNHIQTQIASFHEWATQFIAEKSDGAIAYEIDSYIKISAMPQIVHDACMDLCAGRREKSYPLSVRFLNRALQQSRKLIPNLPIEAGAIASSSLHELAMLERTPEKRKDLRQESQNICRQIFIQTKNPLIAVMFANRIVDEAYDTFIPKNKSLIRSLLAEARETIQNVLVHEKNSMSLAALLVQLSSVFRCQAKEMKGTPYELSYINKSLRAAGAAIERDTDNPATHLELGQALWAYARKAPDDASYFAKMAEAETVLSQANAGFSPLSALALARFYRHTYRSVQAFNVFCDYILREGRVRRMLEESYLFAESAMQIWYSNHDHDFVNSALKKARNILIQAIDSGYQNARLYVDLAQIEAALGVDYASEEALKKISVLPTNSWTEVVIEAATAIDNNQIDRLNKAFAIGIIDPRVWNGLGTYVRNFIGDRDLSLRLYEVGRKLESDDPIVLTNIARILIERGDPKSIEEAKRLVELISSSADKSFIWWRELSDKIDLIKNIHKIRKHSALEKQESTRPTYKQILREYQEFLELDGENAKATAFKNIILRLLTLSYGSKNVKFFTEGKELIEFTWLGDRYLAVPLCSNTQVDSNKMNLILSRSEHNEARSMIFSISGFSEEAIKTAENAPSDIIPFLINGEEIKSILSASGRLDHLLDKKLLDIYTIIKANRIDNNIVTPT